MTEKVEEPTSEIPESRKKLDRLMTFTRTIPVLGATAINRMGPALEKGRDIISNNFIPALGRASNMSLEFFNGLPPQIKKTIPAATAIVLDTVLLDPSFKGSAIAACLLGAAELAYVANDWARDQNKFSMDSLITTISDGFSNGTSEEAKRLERIQREETAYTALSMSRPLGYLAASTIANWGARWSGVQEIWQNNWPEITTYGSVTVAGLVGLKIAVSKTKRGITEIRNKIFPNRTSGAWRDKSGR